MLKTTVHTSLEAARADRDAKPLAGKRSRLCYCCTMEGQEPCWVVVTNTGKALAAAASHYNIKCMLAFKQERTMEERVGAMTAEQRVALMQLLKDQMGEADNGATTTPKKRGKKD